MRLPLWFSSKESNIDINNIDIKHEVVDVDVALFRGFAAGCVSFSFDINNFVLVWQQGSIGDEILSSDCNKDSCNCFVKESIVVDWRGNFFERGNTVARGEDKRQSSSTVSTLTPIANFDQVDQQIHVVSDSTTGSPYRIVSLFPICRVAT